MTWITPRYSGQHLLSHVGSRVVWKAFDHLLERSVVVKGSLTPDPTLEAEVQQLQRCAHPRVVRVLEAVQSPSRSLDPSNRHLPPENPFIPQYFFTQEWLSGPTLRSLAGTLSAEALDSLLHETLELLAFLQNRGVTRLDLKPHHLFRTEAGWKLIDLDQARTDQPLGKAEDHGTLAYTAPECLEGEAGGPQSDLYSLGAVLYEALTGAPPPLIGETLDDVRHFLNTTSPSIPAATQAQNPQLSAIILRLLARKPVGRPESAEALLQELDAASPGPVLSWRSRCPLPSTSLQGRAQALADARALVQTAAARAGGGFRVIAPLHGGRSHFLRALREDLQQQGRPALLLDATTWQAAGTSPLELIERFLALCCLEKGNTQAPHTSQNAVARASGEAKGPGEARSPGETSEQRVAAQLLALGTQAKAAFEQVGFPITILLDDLEALEGVTLTALEHLTYYLAGSGLLLIVGTLPTAALPEGVSALPGVTLPPLNAEDLRALAEALLGPGALHSTDGVRSLLDATHGLPGQVRAHLAPLWFGSSPNASIHPKHEGDAAPLSALLPPALQATARALSILPHAFSPAFAEELLQAEALQAEPLDDERPLPAPPAALLGVGILLESYSGQADELRLHFADPSLRRALEASLSPAVARQLHQRAGEMLERLVLTDPSVKARDIAAHFLAGEGTSRAIPYLHRALLEARAAQHLEEVAQLLGTLAALASPTDPALPELCRQQGETFAQQGALTQARQALETALQKMLESGGTTAPSSQVTARKAQCLGALGTVLIYLGDAGRGRSHLEEAVGLSTAHPALGASRVYWLHLLAWLDLETKALDRAEMRLREASALPQVREPAGQIDAVQLGALLEMNRGKGDAQTRTRLLEALTLARQHGSLRGEAKLLSALARLARQQGDVPTTRAYLEQLLERARASWDPGREAIAAYNLGTFLREQQEPATALEQFERAVLLFERQGNRLQELKARIECVGLMLEHDRLERAESMLTRLTQLQSQLQTQLGSVAPVTQRALEVFWLRLRRGRGELKGLAEALDALDATHPDADESPLSLELLVDRMSLAIHENRPLDALRYYAARRDPAEKTEAPHTWKRIHSLAMQAHALKAGLTAPTPPSPPQPTDLPPSPPAPPPALEPAVPAPPAPPRDIPPVIDTHGTEAVTAPRGALSPADFPGRFGLSTQGWLQALQRLLEFADDEDQLAAELASLAGQLFQGRGLVFLFEGSRLLAGRGYGLETQQVDDVSSTILEQVRERREPFICPDVRANQRLGQLRSLREARVRSVLCYPVLLENACLGVIYIDHVEVGRVTAPQALAAVEQIASLTSGLLASTLQRRQVQRGETTRFGLVGTSKPMMRLKQALEDLAKSNAPDLVVLLLGETGTGKSTIARMLHEAGTRRTAPFVDVNAAAIPGSLFESLMFGYAKGAFTGAVTGQAGWFEMARGGTLFLDEIGDLPTPQQAGLLNALGGTHHFRRLGAEEEQLLDIHLICATSRELKEEVRAGRFRRELLRRIQINTCRVPPLRERGPGDIQLLACHMISAYLSAQGLLGTGAPAVRLEDFVSRQARDYLLQYDWPWNVGQMENLFKNEGIRTRLRTLGRHKVEMDAVLEALDLERREPWKELPPATSMPLSIDANYQALNAWCEQQKSIHMLRVYHECGENVAATAKRMGCSRDVVYKYVTYKHTDLKEDD